MITLRQLVAFNMIYKEYDTLLNLCLKITETIKLLQKEKQNDVNLDKYYFEKNEKNSERFTNFNKNSICNFCNHKIKFVIICDCEYL